MRWFYMLALTFLFLNLNTAQADIINGGFENGNLNGWITDGNGSNDYCNSSQSVVYDTTTNSLVAELTATAALDSMNIPGVATTGLTQTFYASAGESFTFDYRAILPTDISWAQSNLDAICWFGSWARLDIRDARLTTLVFEKHYSGTTVDTDTGWQSESIGPFPHDGLYTASFNLSIRNITGRIVTCNLFLDNINAPGVPEPSALALLLTATLGGFLWWHRRR